MNSQPTDQTPVTAADFTAATEPFALFEAWFAEAEKSEPNDPNAMAVATSDLSGMPNVRMLLLKGRDGPGAANRGFVFYTNQESAKGHELTANPQAALLFHWKSLRRQVRVRGTITLTTAAEADAYFASRSRLSRIGAVASDQSRPLDARATFEARVAALEKQYSGDSPIPRPADWLGYRVTPLEIEFWHDRPYRMHDRIVFRRALVTDGWAKARLYP